MLRVFQSQVTAAAEVVRGMNERLRVHVRSVSMAEENAAAFGSDFFSPLSGVCAAVSQVCAQSPRLLAHWLSFMECHARLHKEFHSS